MEVSIYYWKGEGGGLLAVVLLDDELTAAMHSCLGKASCFQRRFGGKTMRPHSLKWQYKGKLQMLAQMGTASDAS